MSRRYFVSFVAYSYAGHDKDFFNKIIESNTDDEITEDDIEKLQVEFLHMLNAEFENPEHGYCSVQMIGLTKLDDSSNKITLTENEYVVHMNSGGIPSEYTYNKEQYEEAIVQYKILLEDVNCSDIKFIKRKITYEDEVINIEREV